MFIGFKKKEQYNNTNVGTKEEQKDNKMETVTGTLSQLRTKELVISYMHWEQKKNTWNT